MTLQGMCIPLARLFLAAFFYELPKPLSLLPKPRAFLHKETNSAREVILNVALQLGDRQFKNGWIMKELEGKWRYVGSVIP